MKKKINDYSFFNCYKDSFTTAFITPVISIGIIVVTFLAFGYNNGVISIQWIIVLSLLIAIILAIVLLWFVLGTLHAIVKRDKEKMVLKCQNCATDYTRYIFFRHDLISLQDICQLEKNLRDYPNPELCEVYNYTALSDTFMSTNIDDNNNDDTIEKIICNNRKKGVKYKVFYLEPTFIALNGRNIHIYGEENLIDCSDQRNIYEDAEFDFLIHKTPESMKGYVAVNFNSHTEKCGTCPYKPCDYKNENQFYRVLSQEEVMHVYRYLTTILKQRGEQIYEKA